jgi:class 3 adenylate cyclase
MLSEKQIQELVAIVNKALDRCEEQWDNTLGRETLLKASAEMSESKIPGHSYLAKDTYKADVFVAFMLDMRDSTKHLRQAISVKIAKVSQMKRVYFEVSALLPAMTKLIQDKDGAVTEYMGDGLLALFQLPEEKKEKDNVLGNCIVAAKNCMSALNKVTNPILSKRYGLPPLEIGIGLAFSDAIISHFGLPPNTEVKAIGECIYFASQLSKGRNEIIVHENLERIWPTSEGGTLRFNIREYKDFKGYVVTKA